MDEPSRVTDFGAIWRASALSMNADSQNIQDTESQLAGILESQASDDEAMPDRAPKPEVEVPTSSMLSAADAPSTPPAKGEGQNDEEMVLDTPTRDQSHTVSDINGSPVDEETQADAEDEPPDSLRAIPAFNESQMTKEGQSPNGQQANGAKKERLAFNPYDTAALNPRSPLEIGLNEQRLRALPGSVDDSASFEFLQEDHTLGNALRHAIMKNPTVELAGYSIPHPSESKMNIRIQTYDGASAYDALEQGIDDLDDMCDEILKKFGEAREEFMAVDNE